jgi:hypothetical protein
MSQAIEQVLSFVASHTCTAMDIAASKKAKVKSEDARWFDFLLFTFHCRIKFRTYK